MSLHDYLTPKPPPPPTNLSILGARALELIVKLHDETSKTKPDNSVVSNFLQDLDMLVSDYRREQTRSTNT